MNSRKPRHLSRATTLFLALLIVAPACGGDGKKEGTGASQELAGVLRIAAGECADAGVTGGTYFRMVQPGGTPGKGPFVTNTDSPCGDQTWTPMKPGSEGGLLMGDYQPHPDPPFDKDGNGLASRITLPTKWFGASYSLTSNPKDLQTAVEVGAPKLVVTGGRVTGDLRAFAAAWNGTHFNQGSPKPDGSKPGNTSDLTGTYDSSSGRLILDWTSQIVGGPFNNFTGAWHFEGTFEPKAN